MRRWKDIFTPRQSQAIETFGQLIPVVADKIREDMASKIPSTGGAGEEEYAKAVCTYLCFAIDKGANYWSSLCAWNANRDAVVSTFGRQAIAMTWDFIETNPLSSSTGNFLSGVDSCVKSLTTAPANGSGRVVQLDAREGYTVFEDCTICTDPPYFDNIAYAELSDFFYVWMRANLKDYWPELFRRVATPKEAELVAAPFRHGGKEAAETYFMKGMEEAFRSVNRVAASQSITTVFYAFKQSDSDDLGTLSPGWSTFLQGVVESGFIIDGTWPVRTEYTGNLKKSLNVLATSVVLVCRKRPLDADVVTRADFIRALKREMPDAIATIRKAGVGPVDMQQSVIGPGMGVFTRFAKVLEDDDSAMPVKTALSLINRVWDEIENELTEAFDAPTQVALAWFATYGFDARPSGELITLANAKNIPLATLFSSGVFQDLRGKAGLVARADLPEGWSPAIDKAATIWECVQHTIRVLNAEDGGAEAAAALVARMGQRAEDARALAYRLFEIATKKGWASEALIYNALAQEWPRLAEMAPDVIARGPVAAAQATLF
jgi:putative DNA methylase